MKQPSGVEALCLINSHSNNDTCHSSETLEPLLGYFSNVLKNLNGIDSDKLSRDLLKVVRDYSLHLKTCQQKMGSVIEAFDEGVLISGNWAIHRIREINLFELQ
ncbi:hypothetical protein [Legionella fairfieldensis]|uniref:hypothetical protein n=1 Tax=Legionella fairfieldensis TaxID=45064 RepID=UPI00048A44C5|nr:hypothetical protein [Legionella fairfieldensis]